MDHSGFAARPWADTSLSTSRARRAERGGHQVTKENPGCWTRRRAFAQVRHGSNIQLFPYSLVAVTILWLVVSLVGDRRPPYRLAYLDSVVPCGLPAPAAVPATDDAGRPARGFQGQLRQFRGRAVSLGASHAAAGQVPAARNSLGNSDRPRANWLGAYAHD
jgi:hypothetical protein